MMLAAGKGRIKKLRSTAGLKQPKLLPIWRLIVAVELGTLVEVFVKSFA
jgi:hypothetical protein